LLPAGAIVGLLWANGALTSYAQAAHALEFAVNDVGMVFFFGLAAKEVFEATLPGGALSSIPRAVAPLMAAVGGMLLPAAIHLALAEGLNEPALLRGWAIPCATDIAFSYLVARLIFGREHPALPFLLLLAIADDAMGLAILALVYPQHDVRILPCAILVGAALATAWWLRRRAVKTFWPYILGAGSLSWGALYVGGFHPALALVPVIPFIPHGRSDPGFFTAPEERPADPLSQFEHWWHIPVQIILFVFGFVNAGVPLSSLGPGTWVVLIAIVTGKPLGIVLFTAVASRIGFPRPPGLAWGDVLTVGCAAGIGFTVALFFATAAFPPGPLLDQTKMGALMSIGAGALAFLVARVRRCGSGRARVRTDIA
jgi:NhaA family Na+:H+ antiporter